MGKWWSSSETLSWIAFVLQIVIALFGIIVIFVLIRKSNLDHKSTIEKDRVIANANQAAAEARLQTAKLAAVLMPIELDTKQQAALTAACASLKGHSLEITANSPDPESWVLADLISESLRRAGINVDRKPMSGITWYGLGSGMTVGGPQPELVRTLKSALESAGDFSVRLAAEQGSPRSHFFIELGSRPYKMSIAVTP